MMPANLTPQYLEAEPRFKQAKTAPEKIKALEFLKKRICRADPYSRVSGRLVIFVPFLSTGIKPFTTGFIGLISKG